ncbi:hypothetical protein SUGI_0938700 [Cryptomeria japonica]|nr:hypothetical protein SUGI_0938700 [Cryptomeria japonica]
MAIELGTSGEVYIHGNLTITKEYQNNLKVDKNAFQFKWFHTGHISYLDKEGYLFLINRIKEPINHRGKKIFPSEVDVVLLSHPTVAQAMAFGVPDKKYDKEISTVVVPQENMMVTKDDIIAYCKKNLTIFKIP